MHNDTFIILAGGLGTRLRKIISDVPKPMVPVHGKPFLHYLINTLITETPQKFIFSLGYKAEVVIEYIDKIKEKYPIHTFDYVVEPQSLGTGGAIAFAIEKKKIEGDVIIINGDTYLSNPLPVFLAESSKHQNSIGLVWMEDASRYGTVLLDENSKISEFQEKREDARNSLINAGIYRLQSKLFMDVGMEKFSIENEVFPQLVQKKELGGISLKTSFIDIGIPEDYYRFCDMVQNSNSNI